MSGITVFLLCLTQADEDQDEEDWKWDPHSDVNMDGDDWYVLLE